MELDKKITILKYSQYFITFMAGVFFFGQLINLLKPSLFLQIDKYLGLIPSLFNNILPAAKIDMGYRQVPAGYLITAGVCILLYHLINKKIIPSLESGRYEDEEKEQAKALVEQAKMKRAEERATIKQVLLKETFYGLFELQLRYNDDFKKNDKELEKLRLEYYKIFVNKLKTKYAKVEFLVKDKIFFVSNDFDLIHPVTVDILKILEIIIKISKSNSIRINILFSYWVDNKTAGKMNIFRTLSQVNALDNKNKVILTNEVYTKIMSSGKKPWCSANPLGEFRLFNAYNGQDMDVGLYEVMSIEKHEAEY